MTGQTGTEGERHQSQWSGVLAVGGVFRGIEHRLAEGVMTAGFARAARPESVADLRLPLTTVQPQQRRERAPESGGVELRRWAGESGAARLRWARCPDDGGLHLLKPADVAAAITTGGHAEALCGRVLAAEGLTLSHGLAGALCLTCIAAATGLAGVPRMALGPVPRRTS